MVTELLKLNERLHTDSPANGPVIDSICADYLESGDGELFESAIKSVVVTGVSVNGGVRAQGRLHWANFNRRLILHEVGFESALRQYFQTQSVHAVASLRRSSTTKSVPDVGRLVASLLNWEREHTELIYTMATALNAIMMSEGHAAVTDFNLPIVPINPSHRPDTQLWLGKRLQLYSTDITQTTKDQLSKTLTDGYSAGEGIDQLSTRVQDVFGMAADSRAQTISRTEAVSAANRGALDVYKQSGVISGKRWLSTNDERTRDTHAEADGETVGLDEQFQVGGEMIDGPGQGELPENNINCRCTVVPVFGLSDSNY